MPPVYVINRAVDTDRLAGFIEAAATHWVTPIRITADDAHRPDFPFALYDDLIGPRFWGGDDIKPGAIGCFLSHRRAWQALIDSGQPRALICEDDARISEPLDRLAGIADGLGEFDILFANDRLAGWAGAAPGGAEVCGLRGVIRGLSVAGGPQAVGLSSAPGADCYLLTRRGAERLLVLTARQGIQCGVDWAMVCNSLAPKDVGGTTGFPELDLLGASDIATSEPLESHVLATPVATLAGGAPSVLRHAVRRPIAGLLERNAVLSHTEYVSTITLGGVELCLAGREDPDPVMQAHRSGVLWDEPGLRLLLRRFPEGGTFVDIGAHLGNHAVVMGRLSGAGRIIAAEANDDVHRLLAANLAMNGLTARSTIAEPGLAIGAADGEAWLVRNRRRTSQSTVKSHVSADQRAKAERVRVITGDGLIGDASVAAIKIDTSGSEVEVLRGLGATLASQRPVVLIDHAATALDRIARIAARSGLRVDATIAADRKNRSSSLLAPLSSSEPMK